MSKTLRAALADQEQADPPPVLVRDLAELLGTDVPTVCMAFDALGFSPRSTNMAVGGEEALAVAEHLKAKPVRQPLTPSQVHDLCSECYLDWHRGWSIDEEPNRYLLLARAIERAHGITGDTATQVGVLTAAQASR